MIEAILAKKANGDPMQQYPVTSMHGSPVILSGLIGRGIGASRSPRIHEREAAALGHSLSYRLVDFDKLGYPDESLETAVGILAELGFSGSNVTFPFKQQVMRHCDVLSPAAEALGAVNTITFHDGQVHGENTDWVGFTWQVERDIGAIAGARVGQVGAGGAGSATAFALAKLGASEVALYDPVSSRAIELAARLTSHFPLCRFPVSDTPQEAIAGSLGVVNATPVGMASIPGMPFDPDVLEPGQWLADIIYFPLETALLAEARRRGHKVANGVSMVVGQAAEALRVITGLEPDRERMLASLHADISEQRPDIAA